ncbi:hypothetical protein RchiOBHm_Chr6g0277221 [Rosa chinensis]|uniref:Uncharacterized protein n=1 Tax=Rosa chinensis TaxID=74649 RepID=A0A2P6PSF0_ROSCH|nr:hypothetical protein RchiOBHm_Chr6g0277221 [Rosa chinensis]
MEIRLLAKNSPSLCSASGILDLKFSVISSLLGISVLGVPS